MFLTTVRVLQSSSGAKATSTLPGFTGGSSIGNAALPANTGAKTSAASSTAMGSVLHYIVLVIMVGTLRL